MAAPSALQATPSASPCLPLLARSKKTALPLPLHANLQAEMKEPLRSLVQLPVDAEGLAQRLPKGLRPPGL